MVSAAPLPPFAAIVVAAGKGLRVGGDTPKQFRNWRGKALIRHSVEALNAAGADPLVAVIAADAQDHAKAALAGISGVIFITGGATRQDSVRCGLEALADAKPQSVLIHDAARPDLPHTVIERLLTALSEHPGAIPVLPVVDSLAVDNGGVMSGKAERETLRRVQTPQAFRFDAILAAHRAWQGVTDAGDDAQVLMASNGSVALAQGDERLKKITFAEDFAAPMTAPAFRIGQGFDVHRLEPGEELWLGGVQIPHDKGLAGHSDADVALHAITDAVLGAVGEGDIGTHFPPSDPQWRGARSGQFLQHAIGLARAAGYAIANIDLTLICEEPKIGPHRPAMRAEVARLMGLSENAVSIKATTTEKLGFTGRGEGIAAQAIVCVMLASEGPTS
ncbi:2-C-methyl-D-erythritol 4-phosphate cytidylyltransferase/2-C-methyl-D-erythritol 2,4-cyclodiphosphate synthase [Erythromicrobium ramosum]|uniref:Bifunctional enzyme IspD/IspF n=1 Tax=Erythrobacter ramosus TaxID=35811 RepID=A0A6I4UN98_9SPHN|nr:bifunctional 2-C-methyl-D-erythritol 4-phosphate cytidylyltransferase/2-C-methyl-D-erythritol 2,4-cyclodiphosphate synthase [Erythrobacter ramosus]MBB3776009.1 2-C-methyl-D-erythritol 4-phosphate cytidylyltransferase/2-C-methyl-D-erythritol 2,4-cyclodiphosphate synthase [Erythrobacter ramosus]MXP38903.1 bifunctional 2-C-methyl-D-erythritol 4-phosphate cytidylyltransferase/2-C-methyl-D-erythritol 2,4-cyclodiphosphate synthase [Erythrobacter ramosus]